jgi:transcriptional regulator with XRE-family HTH domain
MTPYDMYCLLRDEKGVKDKNVADAIGVSRSTFSDWKSGRSVPKTAKMLKIAKYFDVSYPYLMGLTDQRHLPKNVIDVTATCDMITESFFDAVERGEIVLPEEESTTDDPNDAFYESLTDEQKAEVSRLYQLYLKADPAHKLAVEALLKETPQEPERQ